MRAGRRASSPTTIMATLALVVVACAAPPATAGGDVAAGRDKAQRCRACHGIDGIARMRNVPHLAGESEMYITKQLRAFRSGERSDPQMGVIADDLSDADIADLAAWYSAIEISVEMPDVDAAR
ncbi:MAG: cytochrome c [Halofilum sp. (in: g-proteobacteria)]|nr:cytochrome c [Halofilum sp. (in: g-proteobacteria)]